MSVPFLEVLCMVYIFSIGGCTLHVGRLVKKTERIVFIPDSQEKCIYFASFHSTIHQRTRFRQSNQRMGKLYYLYVCLFATETPKNHGGFFGPATLE